MLSATIALGLVGTTLCGARGAAVLPPSGPIETQDQAATAAFKAAVRVYGRQLIESERPLKAVRSGPFWNVGGTLHRGELGGTVEVTLNAKDGTILDICHGK